MRDIYNKRIINIGCGQRIITGALNVDNSASVIFATHPFLRFMCKKMKLIGKDNLEFIKYAKDNGIKFGDCKKIPVADSSAEIVYSSHMCEHLYQSELKMFFKEAYRVLKDGGVLRIVIPDIAIRLKRYEKDGDADRLLKSLHFMDNREKMNRRTFLKFIIFGNRDHKWMYDSSSFKTFFEKNIPENFECYVLEAGKTKIKDPKLVSCIDLFEREDDSIYFEFIKK